MKTTVAILVAMATLGSTAFAKKIDLDKVPSEILEIIEDHVRPGQLDDLKINVNGKGDKYVIRLKLTGTGKLLLKVSGDGEILKFLHKLDVNQLPKKVRDSVKDLLQSGDEVVEIRRVIKKGQPVYIVTIEDDEGEETKIVISQKGKILQGARDLELEEVPRKLRRAIESLLEDNYVLVDIDLIVEDGLVTFRVEFESEDGTETLIVTYDRNGEVIDEEIVTPL